AGDPERYPGTGDPWQPLKLYYHVSFPKARFEAISAELERRGLDNPYKEWMARAEDRDWREWEITTLIECGEHFETRHRALQAHATQVDPNGFWFAVPLDAQRAARPTEDYHLARS